MRKTGVRLTLRREGLSVEPLLVVGEGVLLEVVPFGEEDHADRGGESVAWGYVLAEEVEVLGVVVGVVAGEAEASVGMGHEEDGVAIAVLLEGEGVEKVGAAAPV